MANPLPAQWKPDNRLTNNPGTSWTSFSNARNIAASGDTVHFVWYDDRNGNNEIYYKRSTDGGSIWGGDTRLTYAPGNSYAPTIIVSGSTVHVFWCDIRIADTNEEIFYKRSEDAGTTWGKDTRLTFAPWHSEFPSIAISGSVLHLVWTDVRNEIGDYENYYKRSTDGGLTWEPDIRLTNNIAYSGFPCVAASGPAVHVVYEDQRHGTGEIYYKRSLDEGRTWGSETRLTNDHAESWNPCISVIGSTVHVVWNDNRIGSAYEIYYKRSTDGGKTWGTDTRLTNAPGDSQDPNIAASELNVHVVWYDDRTGSEEIYYKGSTEGGLSWGADVQLTNASGYAENTSIAISGSMVHIAWMDFRNGNDEVYYKRNPTANLPTISGSALIFDTTQQFSIYASQAATYLQLKLKTDTNQTAGKPDIKGSLTIWNDKGKKMLTRQIHNHVSVIDISGLQNGLYFAAIKTLNKQPVNTKLIILK
ncbi:MAG: hypothetical protein Q8M08_01470 [Bacteroidales bacterium]|nr:hypothetical protein [Bacteroidales bacterium]